VLLNQHNDADGNLYVSMPKEFLGFFSSDSKKWLDLPAWQQTYGWDKNGALGDAQVDFDPDRLELTISSTQPFPKVREFNHINNDLFGNATEQTRTPGPLADPGAKPIWKLDPRSLVPTETKVR
jgi:hypothetical protein